jgi:hypothetical protein
MRSLTVDIALGFLTFSIALFLFNYKSHAKKAFLFSLLLFISPAILVIKESVLSIFPTWVSILLLILIVSIMLKYIFDLFFGAASNHILGDLISSLIKYFSKLIIKIPKLIISNEFIKTKVSFFWDFVNQKSRETGLFFIVNIRKLFSYYKLKKSDFKNNKSINEQNKVE